MLPHQIEVLQEAAAARLFGDDTELATKRGVFVGTITEVSQQKIDPRQAGIDWEAFRESQREVAREAVASAIYLDEVARREGLDPTPEEIDQEVGRWAEGSGRTPAAVRAALEKEGGMSRIAGGLRREKSIDFLRARATITDS